MWENADKHRNPNFQPPACLVLLMEPPSCHCWRERAMTWPLEGPSVSPGANFSELFLYLTVKLKDYSYFISWQSEAFKKFCIYLVVVLGFRCCIWAFSSCGEGPLWWLSESCRAYAFRVSSVVVGHMFHSTWILLEQGFEPVHLLHWQMDSGKLTRKFPVVRQKTNKQTKKQPKCWSCCCCCC